MATFKNIKIKMKGGKSRLQRVKVLASGKFKFVKNLTKSKSNPAKGKTSRKSVRKVAKKKKRRSNSMTIPLAPIMGIIAAPDIRMMAQRAMEGNIPSVMTHAGRFIGINDAGKFDHNLLFANLTPIVVGALVHKFVGGAPLNLNRALGRAKVPFIRI